MLKRLNQLLSHLATHELRAAQMLFLFMTAGFTMFTLLGDNLQVKGPFSHEVLNAIDATVAFIVFLALVFYKPAQKYYQQAAYIFMYVMNIINIYLLYGTDFSVQYAYQFIIAYTISGWFFRDKQSWLVHTLVINALLLIVAILANSTAKTTFDFYATYVIASFAQAILIHFRFSIEEKLIESERKYRLVAENSFDLICLHDVKARLEFISPSVKRLLGYTQEELLGKYPLSIIHPDDAVIAKGVDFTTTNHPLIFKPIQFRLKHKDGEYSWFETIFSLLKSPDGGPDVVLSQSRDIRRSKKYQMELEERGRELERSNADLETFAFVSSHDMQEPLRMISNYMQLLKKRYDGKLDAQADEYIEFANKGAITLQQLLRDLLAYARITRTELKHNDINMNTLFNEVLNNIQMEVKAKNAQVVYPELCVIVSDRNLLMLVVQNLVLNGIKYNQSVQPEVNITCQKTTKEITYCFADNGIGIKPDHQQRIFEPFHRLHTKHEYEGTGLGLSICKKIVERLGGKLWVESELGKGSKFFFSLPLS
ncbi:MAG: PAS domain S-box protein [Chitinophagales bacterium]|nr:PAS domain S-box protein [Chitinophagales bacterium]